MTLKAKNDKYRKARGGYSRFLDVACAKCLTHLFYYQKDGPGILKRAYLDRIIKPAVKLTGKVTCPKCKELIGVSTVYAKEKRKAIRFFEAAVSKKIIKSESRL